MRDQWIEIALSYEGCSAAPATRQRYCDLLACSPEDYTSPRARTDIITQSGCARTVMGFWFNGGLRHPLLVDKYVNGQAVSDVALIGQAYGALKDPHGLISPGDFVIIKNGWHVLTAIEYDGMGKVTSIDGGQRDDLGFELICRKSRAWAPGYLGGRPIAYLIDGDTMASQETTNPLG